jgi:hypothetical protein
VYVYVGLRSKRPELATLRHVMTELGKNEIDVTDLVDWPAHPCPQAESTTEE